MKKPRRKGHWARGINRVHKDQRGRISGKLTVQVFVGVDGYGNSLWECHCQCGGRTVLTPSGMNRGHCGCVPSRQGQGASCKKSPLIPVMVELRSQGMSMGQIAAQVGVTRQRVQQQLKRHSGGKQ